MSLASQVGTAAGVVAAAGAAVSLWLGAEHHAGPLRRAYRWFAVAAALWGVGVIVGQVLAVVAAGFVRLAAAASRDAAVAGPTAGLRAQGSTAARLADGYVLASSLFL